MIKRLSLLITLFLSFGFISQSTGQTLTKKQTEQIKNQVDSVFQKMVLLAEKLDFNQLSSGVDDTREAGFITNGKYYAHYATLIEDVKSNARGLSRQNISVKEKKISVLSDKLTLMTVSGVSKAILDDGREISADFHWSFVYEKIHNSWKVIYSHQSIVR